MQMKLYAVAATLAISMAGCAPIQPAPSVPMFNKFSAEEHRPYLGQGEAAVTGQAFLRQQGGGVVTCAGSIVWLFPATPFFREFVNIAKSGRTPNNGGPAYPEFAALDRRSQCDAQGNFAFSNIPEGRYIVFTEVAWMVGYYRQGGAVGQEVDVPASGNVSVLLSDANRM